MSKDHTNCKKFTESSYKKKLLKTGSLPHCEMDKFYLDEEMIEKTCLDVLWSNCDARTFDIRMGPDYISGQKQPSKKAIYSVFACDGFKMPSKINHVARFMDIKPYIEKYKTPYNSKTRDLPPIIIINLMVPSYPPEVMTIKDNGEGYQLVFYAKMSDKLKEILNKSVSSKSPLPPSVNLFHNFINANKNDDSKKKI